MSSIIDELKRICLHQTSDYFTWTVNHCDEVYPGILVGNCYSAENIEKLKKLNVGYVLNAAYGSDVHLGTAEVLPAETYARAGIAFLGIPAIDMVSYPIQNHFRQASDFIGAALQSGKKVLVHCMQGISRSAALVIAYLIEEKGMDVLEATRTVRRCRQIRPNDGFLRQLCILDEACNKATSC
ncbi:dual specificity protein phosphatase 3-like [Uloborus diversus]|uniref:dual specificity protein phosphatase 3-like n=1 Tax=Uloborus diversus TaxID=327109 RepID=UPI0024090D50|nr:dual specificity protein phosphatase 3-like [Uloborus diversus]